MKKHLIPLCCLLALLLTACGAETFLPMEPSAPENYEIALITAVDGLSDAVSAAVWSGIQNYAPAQELSCQYYTPPGRNYPSAIEQALSQGAKLIICPLSEQSSAAYEAQLAHPDTCFLLLDALPDAESDQSGLGKHTQAILFNETEAGFLAGYVAVRDGYTKLGFCGDKDSQSYGYGFLQGVDAAANELGVEVEMHFATTDEVPQGKSILSLVYPWYSEGTEIIFACGKETLRPVCISAEATGKAVIAADVDQSEFSGAIILSVMKDLEKVIAEEIAAYQTGDFPCSVRAADLASGEIGLSINYSLLARFTQEQYAALVEEINAGKYQIQACPEAVFSPTALATPVVKIIFPDEKE